MKPPSLAPWYDHRRSDPEPSATSRPAMAQKWQKSPHVPAQRVATCASAVRSRHMCPRNESPHVTAQPEAAVQGRTRHTLAPQVAASETKSSDRNLFCHKSRFGISRTLRMPRSSATHLKHITLDGLLLRPHPSYPQPFCRLRWLLTRGCVEK